MPTAGEDLPGYCQTLCVQDLPTQDVGTRQWYCGESRVRAASGGGRAREYGSAGVCGIFDIPLHAARRAMAAAPQGVREWGGQEGMGERDRKGEEAREKVGSGRRAGGEMDGAASEAKKLRSYLTTFAKPHATTSLAC